jgi:cell division protein ZapE
VAAARKDELHRLYERQAQASGFQADAAQSAAIGKLESLRGRLLRREAAERSVTSRVLRTLRSTARKAPPRGVYLHGGVGRGKTWLMDLFFQSLPIERKLRSHFHRFMHDVHAQLKGISQQSEPLHQVATHIAAQARVICFDELFVSDIADAMILGGLFRHLVEQGVALVITSNLPPAALYREGLQRQRFLPAIALLEKHTEIVAVDGVVDYRLRQLTQAEIYLASTAADTNERLYQIFEDLADGPGDAGGTLMIAGRPIDCIRESENVVWFDFPSLCDGPRSQSDYIELAREYQSVIVANIPVLGTSGDNAARRFIALVDEFYDRGVKLIVSAAASPAELYCGERLLFEFRRTISRLTEMQTREYLAREHRA